MNRLIIAISDTLNDFLVLSQRETTARRCQLTRPCLQKSKACMEEIREVRVLAVASGGGHWEQLMLLRSTLERFAVSFATTNGELAQREKIANVYVLEDTNRNHPIKSLKCLIQAIGIVRKAKPSVVISTGALPGFFCLLVGKLAGARTIWIDSAANAEKPSMSGQFARLFATLWLTQWEHLARAGRREYAGALL